MCQIFIKEQNEPITGYKVYKKTERMGGYVSHESYYSFWDRPAIGVRTLSREKPFHAFRGKETTKLWLDIYALGYYNLVIYEVLLEMVEIGVWDADKRIGTATGNYMTVIKDVTEEFIKEGQLLG